MSFRASLKIVLLFFIALTPMVASAQQTGATVRGMVADPENAVIPGATVTFTPASGKALITQSERTAPGGPAAGPNGGQIYVDGFTGGQLPPKSSIREIRINQNPFSAQYDRLGYGRVEVFTKPGTDKFHGQFNLQGSSSALNSGNPLLNAFNSPGQPEQTQPPYHTIFVLGNITGPLAKNASFTLSGSHRTIQDNNLVNATILNMPAFDPSLTCPAGQTTCSYLVANPEPQSRTDINPRIDLALGEKNTLVTRFMYEQNDQNSVGVGGLVAPSAGYNSTASEKTLQGSETQIVK